MSEKFRCDRKGCGFASMRKEAISRHIAEHVSKPFKCSVRKGCYKEFKTEKGLRLHEQLHNEKPYKCPRVGCSEAFETRIMAKRHIKGHSESFETRIMARVAAERRIKRYLTSFINDFCSF